ncbi:MAG: nuclear transport factor 2 family protein [Pseudomonadota bacterium]|nr:nuclear transport factor 2 family protein [Pseudomonadota bacterium]
MSDIKEIEKKVQLYFDSMYESNPDKVREVFHENARVTGYLPGKLENNLHQMTVEEFANFVSSQQPSPKEKKDEVVLEIISCDVAGLTASVRVRDLYLGMMFLDTLSFLKTNNEWKIYNKLFHVED